MIKRAVLLIMFIMPMFNPVVAQEIELLREGSTLPKVKPSVEFHLLHHDIDTTKLTFVGTFRTYGTGSRFTIESFYNKIRTEARKNGANSFRLVRVNRADQNVQGELVVDTYFVSDDIINESKGLKEKNAIYVFSSEMKSEKTTTYKVNNEKKELVGGKYSRYDLPAGEEVKISKGGMSGSSTWFTGERDQPVVYVSLSGFGLAPGVAPPGGGVGVSFNSGRINRMDSGLGELLTFVLEESR